MVWERVTCPKEFGGFFFYNFKAYDLAIVAKQGCIFKARCYPRTFRLDAKIWYNPSFAWKSIWNFRQVLLFVFRCWIRNDSPIRFMNDL